MDADVDDTTAGGKSILAAITRMLSGPIVWAGHLTLVYGLQSVACSLAAGKLDALAAGLDGVQAAILLATLGAVMLLARLGSIGGPTEKGGTRHEQAHFETFVGNALSLLAVFGILGVGLATVMLPSCPALR